MTQAKLQVFTISFDLRSTHFGLNANKTKIKMQDLLDEEESLHHFYTLLRKLALKWHQKLVKYLFTLGTVCIALWRNTVGAVGIPSVLWRNT